MLWQSHLLTVTYQTLGVIHISTFTYTWLWTCKIFIEMPSFIEGISIDKNNFKKVKEIVGAAGS